jgi:hypothetical protein
VSPGHKKLVVEGAVRGGVCSGRAGCRRLKLSRSGYRYRAGQRTCRQQELVKRIHALTDENPRYGYRRHAQAGGLEREQAPGTAPASAGRPQSAAYEEESPSAGPLYGATHQSNP